MAQKLETRQMGQTEMHPNALALGAAWLWRQPDAEVIGAIRRAIALGINYSVGAILLYPIDPICSARSPTNTGRVFSVDLVLCPRAVV